LGDRGRQDRLLLHEFVESAAGHVECPDGASGALALRLSPSAADEMTKTAVKRATRSGGHADAGVDVLAAAASVRCGGRFMTMCSFGARGPREDSESSSAAARRAGWGPAS
jgi:hypothetical protein